ncbi:hypothetical protein K227x_29880 [Rubripirellula lacrimiformis]|uniref:Caspase domain protein n=1 Tax=Rubripirellula lacrimiformis TaxID=1930273 RepID=A0A517NBT5_9BACT|nr:hypothetical protein [Rubripirellula lacrimiformis]QDT04595.1 hypothetical protein K227x_29880 [Rubripirellula lacrimiformis]
MIRFPVFVFVTAVVCSAGGVRAADFFLTIGGGYAPSGNQASLEKNVQLFQRVLESLPNQASATDSDSSQPVNHVFFADGTDPGEDLQVMDRASIPEANRLMAEFFGDDADLGLTYRNHQVPDVQGPAKPDAIRKWFDRTSTQMRDGDRLFVYVTAHGSASTNRKDVFDTTIALWDNTSIKMTEFTRLLDQLPTDIDVVAVMVQCYAGGFSRFCFVDGDPDKGLSPQRRVGFFATVHDRPAAGCTPDVDEANYVEYSTYFWAALQGVDRSGQAIDPPDYDKNGVITFDEAHAYTVLNAITIDLPVTTSGEFLSEHSRFANDKDKDELDLLSKDESYEQVLSLASPAQHAILQGLSQRLDLSGDDRIAKAIQETQPQRRRGRSRTRRPASPQRDLQRRISGQLLKRWPALANVLNPLAIELLTTRSEEFVQTIHAHPDYAKYVELKETSENTISAAEQKVLYERFLRVVENVVLAENLRRIGNIEQIAQYGGLIRGERGQL